LVKGKKTGKALGKQLARRNLMRRATWDLGRREKMAFKESRVVGLSREESFRKKFPTTTAKGKRVQAQ